VLPTKTKIKGLANTTDRKRYKMAATSRSGLYPQAPIKRKIGITLSSK
jgi:hypothetical protein